MAGFPYQGSRIFKYICLTKDNELGSKDE